MAIGVHVLRFSFLDMETKKGPIVFDHDNIESPEIIFIQIMKSERKKESEFTVRFVCVKKLYVQRHF